MLKRSTSLALALLLGGSAFGDDLAALARKEKERRAKQGKPTKVFTEGDGKEGKAGSVTVFEAPPTPSTPAATPGESLDSQKATWKARAEAARNEIFVAQSKLDILEREYAEYQSDIAPVPANELQDPMRLQNREARLQELKTGLEQQKRLVTDAKRSLSAVEDAARAAGIPPGWLR